MNILPLVFAFLMIFAFLSSSSLKQIGEKKEILLSLKGSWNVYRTLDNEFEKRIYNKLPVDREEKTKVHKAPSIPRSIRNSLKLANESKLSLFSLKNPLSIQERIYLQRTLGELLTILYRGTPIEKEVMEAKSQLVVAICEEVRKGKWEKEAALATLKLDDPALHLLFYKLCQGTKAYLMGQKGGYPSLEYFVTLEEFGKSRALYFYSASFPVLAAFFSEEVANEIVEAELEKKQHTEKREELTQTELTTLIHNHFIRNLDHSILDAFISFNKSQKSSFPIRLSDKKSQAFCEVYPNF